MNLEGLDKMKEDSLKQLVVFKLDKEEYGFEVATVREIHDMQDVAKVHRAASHIEGVVNLRGKLLTVINLRKRFDMKPDGALNPKIVVVDAPDAPVGFMVDEVVEVARVPPEAIEKAPAYVASGIEAQYVVGIVKLDDRLITVIDPIKVLELPEESSAQPRR